MFIIGHPSKKQAVPLNHIFYWRINWILLHQEILSNMEKPCDIFLHFNNYMIKTKIIIKIPSVQNNSLFERTNLACTGNRIHLNTLPKILLKLPWETKYEWISIFTTFDKKRGLVTVGLINSKHTVKQWFVNACNFWVFDVPKRVWQKELTGNKC